MWCQEWYKVRCQACTLTSGLSFWPKVKFSYYSFLPLRVRGTKVIEAPGPFPALLASQEERKQEEDSKKKQAGLLEIPLGPEYEAERKPGFTVSH